MLAVQKRRLLNDRTNYQMVGSVGYYLFCNLFCATCTTFICNLYCCEHVLAITKELERLGYRFSGDLSTANTTLRCITTWDDGDYNIWSMPLTDKNYKVHTRTLTLADLTKMETEDAFATNFDTP